MGVWKFQDSSSISSAAASCSFRTPTFQEISTSVFFFLIQEIPCKELVDQKVLVSLLWIHDRRTISFRYSMEVSGSWFGA